MPKQYLVTTRLKKTAKDLGMRISHTAIIFINDSVADMLKKAADRAKRNGRKTIMPHDV